MSKRASTVDRDVRTEKHPTPSPGVPLHEIPDEVTGVLSGPALAEARSRRKTDQRIAHIEKRLDEVKEDGKATASEVTEIRVAVGEMRGELRTVLSHIALGHQTEQVRIGSRAKVIIGIATALAAIASAAVTAGLAGCS